MKKIIWMTAVLIGLSTQQARADFIVGDATVSATEVPKVKVYRPGDFVQIEISEEASTSYSKSRSGSRDTELNASLAKWIRINSDKILKPSAIDAPEIEFESDTRFANTAADKFKSTLKESITAQVKDIRPNGNLYIEGHKEIRENGDIRIVNISGEVSKADADLGGTVLTQKIYNLKVEIIEEGDRRANTDLNLLQQFLVWIWPF
jgi:flagellar L-ring protein precursor FlgH